MDMDENNDLISGSMQVIVEPGDSINAIAMAFETTPEAIQAMNPGLDMNRLAPEQILQIPFPIGRCEGTVYVVRRGDTLASIARQFGVSEEDILRENPFLRIIGVRPGLQICIPRPQPVQCPGGFFYTVVAGDTLVSIARRFNTTVGAIVQANPGLVPGRLFPGQRICIPGQRPPECPGGFFYTVMVGDTLVGIANRFNTSVGEIIRANPGLEPGRLFPGQRICIPGQRPPECPGGFFYTVMVGDTLLGIANRFNTSVAAILQANPGLDPSRLFPGQRICIPAAQPPLCPGGFFYTIAAGDTLFSIATRFNTTVNAILQANPGLDPNRLFVGQRICIPVPRPPACTGFLYTVVAGDTLNSIAFRFRTTVPAILQANPGLNPDFIVIGQQICIPTGQPTPVCSGFIYTVVAGDTLNVIAGRFNTTVNAILQANPGLDPLRLFVGQQICIPR